ncbi:MAG TPA: competence/damage-inducible protein A [Candidatus Acidoferrales bacterium]|nr:competence/damage-inducible protein A [Candidatus Acidoferrales bacterium]
MKAEIIAVGSEMLTPYRADTNSLLLTAELNRLGIEVVRKVIVGDDRATLRETFREALERVDLVVAIGGLGPTEDDVTREAAAEQLGRKLILREEIVREMQERFRRFGRVMSESNKRQAMVPEGATVLENKRGTAPGLWMEQQGRVVILLPGPPHELKAMVEHQVRPRLEKLSGGLRLHARDLRVAMLPESEVDQRIAPIYTTYTDAQTTILAAPGEIQIHLRTWSHDSEAANRMLDELAERIRFALGEAVFTTLGEEMEGVVAAMLYQHRATIAVAESCTGGLVAQRLTSIPGSSTYFLGGVVCYSNELKSAWVDVPQELIETKGAVSTEVAVTLAEGIRRGTGATLGLGITGITGPGGGTPEKPVGTVHIALADDAATKARAMYFPGDRERIRMYASQAALDLVRKYLLAKQREVTKGKG